jgi:hypothetical protein
MKRGAPARRSLIAVAGPAAVPIRGRGQRLSAAPLVILVLTGQLGQFQAGGVFGDGRVVAAFLLAIIAVHAASATAARGMNLVGPFYWDQNDQARSFANRFIAAMGWMPDPAHAACVAVRRYLRAVVAIDDADAAQISYNQINYDQINYDQINYDQINYDQINYDQINRQLRRTPGYFFACSARLGLSRLGLSILSLTRLGLTGLVLARLGLNGRRAIDLSPAARQTPAGDARRQGSLQADWYHSGG